MCHVITRLIVGGAQETALLTCAGLDPRRYDVTLITGPQTGAEGELFSEAARLGVRVEVLDPLVREISPLKDVRALFQLWSRFRGGRFDVVHSHSSKAGILARAAAALARVPVTVHTVNGWSFHDHMSKWLRGFYILAERALAPVSDRLIVVTTTDLDKGLRNGIGHREHYVIVRNGIDLQPFFEDGERGAAAAGAEGAFVIGTLTRLSPQKAPDLLIRAAAKVIRAEPRVRLVIVGDGPLREDVEKLSRELGIQARVVFTGIRRDVPAVLRSFDLFAHASLWEGLPKAVTQAMAAGVPVVAMGADGVEEAVENGVTGLLVTPGDHEAMADAMLRLVRDGELAGALAKEARTRVDLFSLSRMVADTARLYEGLLNERFDSGLPPAD